MCVHFREREREIEILFSLLVLHHTPISPSNNSFLTGYTDFLAVEIAGNSVSKGNRRRRAVGCQVESAMRGCEM